MRLRSTDLTWREIDGDLVILDLRSSTYLTTNASGAVLMKELTQDRTTAELVEILTSSFDVPQAEAEADVDSFLTALSAGGLLESAGTA